MSTNKPHHRYAFLDVYIDVYHNGNKASAAKALGVSRSTVTRRCGERYAVVSWSENTRGQVVDAPALYVKHATAGVKRGES